ncbi:MAG: hypothetical protein ACK4TA_02410 [Saprospiraceae bacterium]
MQIDVGACIAELLYEHQSVTIPGLGAFVSAYKPANIDQVEGKIAPPSKQISFNKNLLIDDGLLVKQLREKFRLSYGEAMRTVDDYAREVKEKIDRREIVTFPKVGRLYKDYEQNYQFLPDETNFNTDSYGLPTLEYFPVVRTVQEKTQAAAASKPYTPVKITQKNWLQRNLLLVSSLGAFVVAGSVYILLQNPKSVALEEPTPSVPTARYNVSPSENEETAADVEEVNARSTPDTEADDSASEAATLKPGTKSAIITIGTFSNPDNVERLIKRIYKAGYEPYTEKVGKNTRVGVQFKYDKSSELTAAVREVSQEFDTKASIYKK